MNNPVFFSSLGVGIVVTGLGFSNYHKVEESLPFVGALSEASVLLDSEIKASEISEFIGVSEEPSISPTITKYNELPCAKDLFANVSTSWESLPEGGSDESIEIKDPSKLKGCLSVWWDKQETNGEEEQERYGNVMWSMSDENQGSIFFSKVSVSDKSVKRVSEKLYFLRKGDDGDAWEIFLSKSEGAKEGEVDDYESLYSESGWSKFGDSTEQKDWTFLSEDATQSCDKECQESSDWSEKIIDWLDNPQGDDLFFTAFEKYEEIDGRFESKTVR